MKRVVLAWQMLLLSSMLLTAATDQELLDLAKTFPPMPITNADLLSVMQNRAGFTFGSGTPFNDLVYTMFDTDYMEGETNGFDIFYPVDPADDFPGTNRITLSKGTSNPVTDVQYGGARGDRFILGTHENSVPFFLKGPDGVDNDYAVILHFDYNHGYIELKGSPSDYQLVHCEDGCESEGYFLFYTVDDANDLVAFIHPCWVFDTRQPPQDTTIFCNDNQTLSLTNPDHFKFAQPISSEPVMPEGVVQFGTNGKDNIGGITVDHEGNMYLYGCTDGNMDGQEDANNEIFIVKLDTDGETQWVRELPMKNGTLIFDAIADETFLYAAGRTLGALPGFTNNGMWDAIILKLRLSDGEIEAMDQWGNPKIDGYGQITMDDANHLYVSGAGGPQESGATDDDHLLAKYDKTTLTNVWRVLDTPVDNCGMVSEAWGGITYVPGASPGDGKLVVAGWQMCNGSDGFISIYENLTQETPLRTNGTGVASQTRKADWILDSKADSDGNLYFVGYTTGNLQRQHAGDGDAFIVKYTPLLTDPQFVQIGTEKSDQFRKLEIDNEGNLYAIGYTYGDYATQSYTGRNLDESHLSGDILIQKFDSDLNKLAAFQFGTDREERGYLRVRGNTVYVGGVTEASLVGPSAGSFDGFAVRLDTNTLRPTDQRVAGRAPTHVPRHTGRSTYSVYNQKGQVLLKAVSGEEIARSRLQDLASGILFIRNDTYGGACSKKTNAELRR